MAKNIINTQAKSHRINLIVTISVSYLLASIAMADIYSYVDEQGVRHLSNRPGQGAERVMRTPTFKNSIRTENVQATLNTPRFSRKPSMTAQNSWGTFANKNRSRPVAITLSGQGSGWSSGFSAPFSTAFAMPAAIPFKVNSETRQFLAPYIAEIAAQYNLDVALMHAVISAESAYNAKAVSPAGAQGLMQLMPMTAKRFGVVDSFDPIQNMRGGAAYLRFLLDKFDNLHLAIAGYNAGEGAVMKYGGTIPPYAETQAYVPRVLAFYQQYRTHGI